MIAAALQSGPGRVWTPVLVRNQPWLYDSASRSHLSSSCWGFFRFLVFGLSPVPGWRTQLSFRHHLESTGKSEIKALVCKISVEVLHRQFSYHLPTGGESETTSKSLMHLVQLDSEFTERGCEYQLPKRETDCDSPDAIPITFTTRIMDQECVPLPSFLGQFHHSNVLDAHRNNDRPSEHRSTDKSTGNRPVNTKRDKKRCNTQPLQGQPTGSRD